MNSDTRRPIARDRSDRPKTPLTSPRSQSVGTGVDAGAPELDIVTVSFCGRSDARSSKYVQ